MPIRVRSAFPISLVLVGATILVPSGASISAGPNRATPAPAAGHRSIHTRRPNDGCGSFGPSSFVGGGQNNCAESAQSGIVSGDSNRDFYGIGDVIGAGSQNNITNLGSASSSADYSFIGAGFSNTIAVDTDGSVPTEADSFIGAGNGNSISDVDTGIIAGQKNTIDILSVESIIGAGANNYVGGSGNFVGTGTANRMTGDNGFIGAGLNNQGGTGGDDSSDLGDYSEFVGAGSSNAAIVFGFVGSGTNNVAKTFGGFVGGGGMSSFFAGANSTNCVCDLEISDSPGTTGGVDGFVGAGDANTVADSAGFIGAGFGNRLSGLTTSNLIGGGYSAIGGGYQNTIRPLVKSGAQDSVIAGGIDNTVTGSAAAIGGGYDNVASGEYSVSPGGFANSAIGMGSFAAGARAQAQTNGAFVWSDGSVSFLTSSAPDQFLARASGGFLLASNAAASVGVKLAAGAGAWSSLSDRYLKRDIVALDDAAILDRVAKLSVNEWSYRSERGVRHVGPMAQDFYAAFGVGADDRHIASIDEDGVTLAAIKALHARNAALAAGNTNIATRTAALRRELTGLRDQGADLRAQVSELEHQVAALARRSDATTSAEKE
jgi:hypothetical protein